MNTLAFKQCVEFIKSNYPNKKFIALHEPTFRGNEKSYLLDVIDTTYVSSVGAFVEKFEQMMCEITGASHAVAIVNGTNALHMALLLASVDRGDEVITQSLTFIATCNAISYLNACPVFVDIDRDTLGLSPEAFHEFLKTNAERRADGFTYNKHTNRRIKACVPMHSFGLPCRVDELLTICENYNIELVEDAAESLGSEYKGKHTGTFGRTGVFSFNGNKIVTCGGGGALVTDDEALAKKAKHLTTQAKMSHKWAFNHDAVGYNYRMPNLNAALACAQLEQLDTFVENKRALARRYDAFFENTSFEKISEISEARSNYWLNAILLDNVEQRDSFLEFTNGRGVMTRPSWELMHRLPMFEGAFRGPLTQSEWIGDRLVNIPSSITT